MTLNGTVEVLQIVIFVIASLGIGFSAAWTVAPSRARGLGETPQPVQSRVALGPRHGPSRSLVRAPRRPSGQFPS